MSQLPNLPFRECIACDMQNHRFAKILDHADGSVTLDKLSNEVKAKLGGGGGSIGAPGTAVGAEKFNNYDGNIASGGYSHAEGHKTQATGTYAHAEGSGAHAAGKASHAEGEGTTAAGAHSHAEGQWSQALGASCHAEGLNNITKGANGHVEGNQSRAYGHTPHAEGYKTTALGHGTHAEGASSNQAETFIYESGTKKIISNHGIILAWKKNKFSLVKSEHFTDAADETLTTIDSKQSAGHGEGKDTLSLGYASHAEGRETIAEGDYSHASGYGTHAKGTAQTVVGQFNAVDEDALFIVGNGTSDADRRNAFCVYKDGTITAEFTTYTKEEIDAKIGDIDAALDELHAYAQALVNGGAN